MLPVQVTLRGIDASEALSCHITRRAKKLIDIYPLINHLHIVVEPYQRNQHQGNLYRVNIDTQLPGKEIVVNRNQYENVYLGVRNSFETAKRLLDEYLTRKRQPRKIERPKRSARIKSQDIEEPDTN